LIGYYSQNERVVGMKKRILVGGTLVGDRGDDWTAL
jgi:hypothetical protein